MTTYLLDTNIFIAALKAHPAVRARLESLPAVSILVSPIVLGELETGVEKSAQVERNRARLGAVVGGLAVPALDAATSSSYARILRIPTIVTAHTDERDRCSVRASVVFRV